MLLKDPSTRTKRFRNGADLFPVVVRKLKNKKVIIAHNTKGGFNLYFETFDPDHAEVPRCEHMSLKGKIAQTKISISRQALECLIMSGIEILQAVDEPDVEVHTLDLTVLSNE